MTRNGPPITRRRRTALPRALIALGIASLGSAAGPSAASGELLAEELRPTPVTAGGGMIVWSAYDEQSGRYRLKIHARGVTRVLPVRSRAVPFDADLGRLPNGDWRVTYSRCRNEAPVEYRELPEYARGRRCRLFEFDPRSRRERPLRLARSAVAGVLPTRWGDRLAFAVPRPSPDSEGRLRIFDFGTKRFREVDEGPQGASGTQPLGMDLRDVLAYIWRYTDENRCEREPEGGAFSEPVMTQLRVWTRTRGSRRLTGQCTYDGGMLAFSPTVTARRVTAGAVGVPPPSTGGAQEPVVATFATAGGPGRPVTPAIPCLISVARVGEREAATVHDPECRGRLNPRVLIERRELAG